MLPASTGLPSPLAIVTLHPLEAAACENSEAGLAWMPTGSVMTVERCAVAMVIISPEYMAGPVAPASLVVDTLVILSLQKKKCRKRLPLKKE